MWFDRLRRQRPTGKLTASELQTLRDLREVGDWRLIMFALALAIATVAAPSLTNDHARSMAQLQVTGEGVRMRSPLTVAVEGSHHGLAGVGLNFWYQLSPRFALDTGVGLSSSVAKLGARLRYNFITDEFTPFVAAGLSVGTGSFGRVLHRDAPHQEARYTLGISPYAQALAGVAYQSRSGFALMAGLGWSQLLVPRNLAWKAAPTPRQRKEMPLEGASGLLGSFAIGYAL